MTGRVLVIDDEQSVCELVAEHLRKRQYLVEWRTSAITGLEATRSDPPDVVVTDLNMRGMSGLEVCNRIVTDQPDIPVIVITAFGSLETAIAAMRAGAYDFVTKPFEMEQLELTLNRAIGHKNLREEVKRLRRAVSASPNDGEIIGLSPPMKRMSELIARVGDSTASVLVTGESGTGKELVARALHQTSSRRSGPFVAVNCAALPEALLESELFGHTKGAFTDASAGRKGLFVRATGGTLLLDELGELPLSLQPKLLRALQSRTVRPVGADDEIPFDVRLIAATNHDLETSVEERRFREDLFYRINVVQIEVPPLRSRGGDVLVLAQHFLEAISPGMGRSVRGLSAPAAAKLLAYSWPGNVRELQNCIERAVAMARYDEIMVEDLPAKVSGYRSKQVMVPGDDPAELLTMEEVERRYIVHVLEAVGNNKTLAARALGFDRATLYRKLERFAERARR